MIKLSYAANNSGGDWWLTDQNWRDLEAAGWRVEWIKDSNNPIFGRSERWLGALAKYASKDFETPDAGIKEWTRITGQDPWEEGCNCCGEPHRFSYEDKDGKTHYASIAKKTTFGGWT